VIKFPHFLESSWFIDMSNFLFLPKIFFKVIPCLQQAGERIPHQREKCLSGCARQTGRNLIKIIKISRFRPSTMDYTRNDFFILES